MGKSPISRTKAMAYIEVVIFPAIRKSVPHVKGNGPFQFKTSYNISPKLCLIKPEIYSQINISSYMSEDFFRRVLDPLWRETC